MIQSTHIMQAVSQLDQDHSKVFRHGHEHLAMIFRQLFFVRLVFDFPKLGHTIHNHAHIMTEFPLQIVQGRRRILYDIMQKTTGY